MPAATIGILGGIFDPVHNGHLAAAFLAQESLGLEKVIFIPSGQPPHKSRVQAAAAHRLAMLQSALAKEPDAVVWDREILRAGPSYTIDTLHELRTAFPESQLHFIIGSDNISEILTWRNYSEILEMVTLCVGLRPGYPMIVPEGLSHARIREIPSPFWGISSTMIREYLASGYRCRHLLPEPVIEYIFHNGLYRFAE